MRTNHIPPLLCISILFGGCSASPSVEANYQITRDIYAVTRESRYSLEWNYSDFKLDDCGRIIEEKQGIHILALNTTRKDVFLKVLMMGRHMEKQQRHIRTMMTGL